MDYQNTLTYLYESVPMFQQIGSGAYKEGLENTKILDEYFGHPHREYRTIHVGGTNGKGSCSHTLAAIFQEAGYRVGLYTSPHLVDFRERIRINGEMMPEEYVINFVEKHRSFFEPLHPSFFELTTVMAFRYFADEKVDVAIIEVGLGGRLDCTNIIAPDLCIITNISFDHTQFLDNTLVLNANSQSNMLVYETQEYPRLEGELGGCYQIKNTNTILHALKELKALGYRIEEQSVRNGFSHVNELTGLMGRWQQLSDAPLLICDTGHNIGGIAYITQQIKSIPYHHLHIVIGMVNDKDIRGVLSLLPQEASYYFTKASVKRALPEGELQSIANEFGLKGTTYPSVESAVRAAQEKSLPKDFIFVGGSSFIVADLLASRNALNLN